MIVLPPVATPAGIETRMLIAEVRGPFLPGYNLPDATKAMQWMHIIVQNRMANPKPFGASEGTVEAVIKAHNQFAGFDTYPNIAQAVLANINAKLAIANATRDRRSADFVDYINAAITTAASNTIVDPSPGKLTAWKTAGANSPGPTFTFYQTLLGNDYYYQ